MKFRGQAFLMVLYIGLLFCTVSCQDKTDTTSKPLQTPKAIAPVAPPKTSSGAKSYKATREILEKSLQTAAKLPGDTLEVEARLIEIPGKFPPNDLYNYVYIMKYRVVKVLKGSYTKKEILVGHYNPLLPRSRIKDKMAQAVQGTVRHFEVSDKHILTLIKPIDRVWKEAVEDDYSDSDLEAYFALKADTIIALKP